MVGLVLLVQFATQGFRNLEPLRLQIAPGNHLVLGDNGAGKTSFLEAVYLLATTRSFRASRIADCCRHGSSSFLVQGETDTARRMLLSFSWDRGHRDRLLNRRKTSLSEYLGALPVVCWSANESEVLVGPPAARRRFLDRGILGLRPAAIEVLSRYRQVLQEKRRLLQSGGQELRVWNEVMAKPAFELVRLRSEYVGRLTGVLSLILKESLLDLGRIEIRYRSSLKAGLDGVSAITTELMEASAREKALQQPILGPHRDELVIRWDGHDLRRVASAGERKAVGLLILAAHGRVLEASGRSCIYLLDDVDTELDQGRLTALWQVLGTAKQTLITSNRPQVWSDIAIDQHWRCTAGVLRPMAI